MSILQELKTGHCWATNTKEYSNAQQKLESAVNLAGFTGGTLTRTLIHPINRAKYFSSNSNDTYAYHTHHMNRPLLFFFIHNTCFNVAHKSDTIFNANLFFCWTSLISSFQY